MKCWPLERGSGRGSSQGDGLMLGGDRAGTLREVNAGRCGV